MISTKAFADLCGVDPETVRRWVRAKKLTPAGFTPGGQLRFRPEQAEQLLASPRMTERAQDIAAHVNASRNRMRLLLKA